ncbi:putative plexin-B3 [Sesbania bispinosa]|nr:putative plexin-B3 [Sesbania bispinosa]
MELSRQTSYSPHTHRSRPTPQLAQPVSHRDLKLQVLLRQSSSAAVIKQLRRGCLIIKQIAPSRPCSGSFSRPSRAYWCLNLSHLQFSVTHGQHTRRPIPMGIA